MDKLHNFLIEKIIIRPVNDAPLILSGGAPASDIQNQLVIQSNNPLGLALSFEDADASNSGQEEASDLGFQLSVKSVELNNNNEEQKDAFVYAVAANEVVLTNKYIAQPTNSDLGKLRWVGSISQGSAFATHVSVNFLSLGDFVIEIVAADNGRAGYCTPDVVLDTTVYPGDDIRTIIGANGKLLGAPGYEASRCNRVSAVELRVKVNVRSSVIGGIASGAGAGLLALLALGAVVFAKMNKPEDLDAWQALDNAQITNAQTSGIHKSGKNGGQSALYEGK